MRIKAPPALSGLPEPACPFRHREILAAACGRLCLHRREIGISTLLAGRKVGIGKVDGGTPLVSFMHHDPGYLDLERRTLQLLDNPFGARLSPM
jgi:hypothetical protein